MQKTLKTSGILGVMLLAFMVSNTASAQVNAGVNVKARVDLSPTMQKPRATTTGVIRAELQDLRARIASSTQKRMERRVEHRYNVMVDRFQAAIERESSIIERIVSRIEKMKTNGDDTSVAEGLVLTAKTKLTEAQTSLDSLKVLAEAEINFEANASATTTIKSKLTEMRKLGQEIQKDLKEVHTTLVRIVGNLMGLAKGKLQATTTAEVNVQN